MEKKGVKETVINELLKYEVKKNVRIPYLSGIIRGVGELIFSFGGFVVEIKHTNKNFIYGIVDIVEDIYGEKLEVECNEMFLGYTHDKFYRIVIDAKISSDLLERCCITKDKYEFVRSLPKEFLTSTGAKKAFLKGLFLSCGFIKVPEENLGFNEKTPKGGYTLTFNLNSDIIKQDIITLIAKECLINEDSIRCKKNSSVIYLKSGEAICNVLTFMGAVEGSLKLFGVISSRKMRNDLNRANNCDLANINKVVDAGSKHLEAIRILESSEEYVKLSDAMKETCEMRKRYPDIGIEELGKLFSPPISKSCLNHRLRKIVELSESCTGVIKN